MESRVDEYLVHLLVLWKSWATERSWYLANFLPRVIEDPVAAAQNAKDREVLLKLRGLLDEEEWAALGNLLVQAYQRHESRILAIRAQRAAALKAGLRSWESDFQTRWRQEQDERHAVEGVVRGRLEQRRASLIAGLRTQLSEDFLGAPGWLRAHDPDGLVSDEESIHITDEHVSTWFRLRPVAADQTSFEPNPEQVRAIATVDRHTLVAARAGSGKTTTMVARALFLVEGCGVDPAQIMLLAFNKRAAGDLEKELRRVMSGDPIPHVMTFHALAHRLVDTKQALLYDSSDTRRPLTRYINEVVLDLLRDPDGQARVRDVMLDYFRQDWSRVVARGDHLSASEQVAYRRNLQYESLKGDFVKSYGEKVIANTLFTHNIAGDHLGGPFYGYEHDVSWNGFNYKPDFSIYDATKTRRVVIEYFGMAGEPEYDAEAQRKREFWSGRDEAFLEYFPRDLAQSDFEERLVADLRDAGVRLRRLSDVELWDRMRSRAVYRLTEVVTNLIGRARQRRWAGADLRNEWGRYASSSPGLDRFVELGAELLDKYLDGLAANAAEDFSGLMWRAVDTLRNGTTRFGHAGRIDGDLSALRYLVIDEFQDFSLMFFELTKAALAAAPDANLMVVGDDWQAINEFAGSTTEYFESFQTRFSPAKRLVLSTNRRSSPELVDIGNRVMARRGAPAAALVGRRGEIREFVAEHFVPTPLEADQFGNVDRDTPALLRLLQDHHKEGRSVAVLSRVRGRERSILVGGEKKTFTDFESYGAALRKMMEIEDPRDAVFSSTHGFKGDEADAVILVDVNGSTYPLIHPTWSLFQVFGDTLTSISEAERRLFYVGVSRPHTHLDVITSSRTPCPFWIEARPVSAVTPTSWARLPEFRAIGARDRVELRVRNDGISTFEASRAALLASRFKWRPSPDMYWHRVTDRESFDPALLLGEPWARHPGIRIEAHCNGAVIFRHLVPQ